MSEWSSLPEGVSRKSSEAHRLSELFKAVTGVGCSSITVVANGRILLDKTTEKAVAFVRALQLEWAPPGEMQKQETLPRA